MSNYGWFMPVQASSFAAQIDMGIWGIHIIMGVIFLLWLIFFAYLLFTYREREGHKAERVHISHKASLVPDVIIIVLELIIVIVYAIPTWSAVKMNFPDEKDSTVIDILAEQFNWNVRYPGADGKFGKTAISHIDFSNPFGIDPEDADGKDDIVTVNDMHFPIGKPVLAKLASKDVIHSFFVPVLRLKQDVVPGRTIPAWFEATATGEYEIACAELCGFGHYTMRAILRIETSETWAAWVAE